MEKNREQLILELKELQERLAKCTDAEVEYRKRIEQLKESAYRYRKVFESAQDMIVLLDTEGRIIDVNEQLTKLAGYRREELVGKNLRSLIKLTNKKGLTALLKNFGRRMAGFKVPPYEIEMVKKNGVWADFEINAVAIKEKGKIVGDLAVIRDITERKKAEKVLASREAQSRAILEAIPDIIFRINKQGIFLDYHTTKEQILYRNPKDFLGRKITDILPVDIARLTFNNIGKTLKTGGVQVFEYQLSINDIPHYWEARMARSGEEEVLAIIRDITDRKEAEARLRESEEQYRNTVELAPDGIIVIDQNGYIISSNPAFSRLTGVNRERIVGSHFTKLPSLRPADVRWYLRMFKILLKGEVIEPFEAVFRHRDGSERVAEVHSSIVKKQGSKVGFQAIVRDITERKKADQALRESEEKYKTLTENINVGIYRNTAGPEGRFIEVNPAHVKIFGYSSKKEFLKVKVADLYQDPHDRERFNEKMTHYGYVRNEELRLKKKDGSPLIASVSAVAVKDEQGHVQYYDGIIEDITERKLAEESLRESEEKYRAAIEQSADNIYLMDVETKQIIETNATLQKLLGYRAEEMRGMKVYDFVAHDPEDIEEKVNKIVRAKRAFVGERRYRHKNGSLIDVEVSASYISLRGRKAVFVVSRDITERKLAEERLRETERRYTLAASAGHVGVWDWNLKTDEIYLDPNLKAMLGYQDHEIQNQLSDWGKHVYPDDQKAVMEKAQAHIQGITPLYEIAHRMIHKDGSIRWFLARGTAIRDKDGQAIRVIGTDTDITERIRFEEALQQSEIQIRTTIDAMADAIHLVDRQLRIMLFNKTFRDWNRDLGFETEVIGKTIFEVFPFLTDRVREEYEKVFRSGEVFVSEETNIIKGRRFVTETRKIPVFEKGKVVNIVTVVRDITERKQAEEALKQSEEKYKTLTENVNVGIYRNTPGPQGRFVEVNPALIKMFGYPSREEFLLLDVADLYQHPRDRRRFSEKLLKDGFVKNEEIRLKKKDGTPFIGSVSAVTVRDERGEIKYFDGIIEDVTGRKKYEKRLEYLAHHDPLTSLPNRTLFKDRLEQEIRHATRNQQKLVIMLLDLDRFKHINDTLGHNIGDGLLQCIGNRLMAILRRGDTVARMGGDEFMLLLPELASIEDISRIALKILSSIRKPCTIDGHELNITTSIGIAIYPEDGADADTLMKNADIAMYRAKDKGRNDFQRYSQDLSTDNK